MEIYAEEYVQEVAIPMGAAMEMIPPSGSILDTVKVFTKNPTEENKKKVLEAIDYHKKGFKRLHMAQKYCEWSKELFIKVQKKYPELKLKLTDGQSKDDILKDFESIEKSLSNIIKEETKIIKDGIFDECIYYNFDKWRKSKNNNILFITGLSGSGKTTYSKQIAKQYNATILSLDELFTNSNNIIINKIKESEVYSDYIKYKNSKDKFSKLDKLFSFIINSLYSDPNILYIVEGVQLFDETFDSNMILNKPIIIKLTPTIISILRGSKRDDKSISNIIKNINGYINNKKLLDKFISILKTQSIQKNTEYIQEAYKNDRGWVHCQFCDAILEYGDDNVTGVCPQCGRIHQETEENSKFKSEDFIKDNRYPVPNKKYVQYFLDNIGRIRYSDIYEEVLPIIFEKAKDYGLTYTIGNKVDIAMRYKDQYPEVIKLSNFILKSMNEDVHPLDDYLKYDGNDEDLSKTGTIHGRNIVDDEIDDMIDEADLSTKERNALPDSAFGLPKDRKYPLIDKEHVLQAIRWFNKCEPNKRKELARNIRDKVYEYDMVIHLTKANKLCDYVDWDEDDSDRFKVKDEKSVLEEETEIPWETYQDGFYHPDEIAELVDDDRGEMMLNDNVSLSEWFKYYNARCKLLTPYNEEMEKAWFNKMKVANESEMIKLGWNPKLEFNSENRYLASQRLISVIKEYNQKSIIESEYITEEEVKDKAAVHVLLSATNSNMAKLIRKYTGDPMSHASISFDLDLKNVYSFNGKGFVKESLSLFKSLGNIPIQIYTIFTSKVNVMKMKMKIQDMLSRQNEYSYNTLGLLGFVFNKPYNPDKKMFCSQFVDDILRTTDIDTTMKVRGLVKPMDFATSKIMIKTYDGNINDYNPKKALKELKEKISTPLIESTENIDTQDLCKAIVDGGYMYKNRWNSLVMTEEYPDKLFRRRMETIIIKEGMIYIYIKDNGKYEFPGGGIEPNTSEIQQAVNEVLEEARIKVKDIQYSGVTYTKLYEDNSDQDVPIKWDGEITSVYVAKYDGKYEGDIEEIDKYPEMLKYGQWRNYSEIKGLLSKDHIKAYMLYVSDNINEETSSISFDNKGDLTVKKFMNYQSEYNRCHKLLLTYEETSNYEGMKYELAKLWYINYKLENKIDKTKDRKKLMDIRARVLNDFNKYIKVINSVDNSFNFSEYIKSTPYNPDNISISRSTIDGSIDVIKKLIQKR